MSRCGGAQREAVAILDVAAELQSDDAEELDAFGALYSLCDEAQKAEPMLRRAVELEPENARYVSNLALVERMTGKLASAEKNFDRSIDLDPHDYKAYFSRADLKRWTRETCHITQMENLIEGGIPDWRGETAVRFALAKEFEGDFQNAFRNLKLACDLQRKHTIYDIEEDVATIDHIIASHTREKLAAVLAGCPSSEPIFVLGLPRTGTTLVERILSSHSQVYAAGELNNFPSELIRLIQGKYLEGKQRYSKKEFVDRSLEVDPAALGENYINSTRPRTSHTSRFVDKLPLNYLYCGVIHVALPNAKIVMLERNPMDTCFSVYRMMFMGIYPFSYDLEELGQYFVAFRRLRSHWERTLGDAIKVVKYEDLVGDRETKIRELLSFCELPWEEQCVTFHKNEAASTTASAVQVRRPIYSSSIGRWRNYEEFLDPLMTLLRNEGIPIPRA